MKSVSPQPLPQLGYLYSRRSRITIVLVAAYSLWICWATRDIVGSDLTAIWGASFALIQAARLTQFQRLSQTQRDRVSPAYLAGNFVTGLYIGMGAAFVLSKEIAGWGNLICAGVAGLCGISVAIYGGHPKALQSFIAPLMIPPIATQFVLNSGPSTLAAWAMLIGWITTFGTGRQVADNIKRVIDGRAAQSRIADELRLANAQAEMLNRQLATVNSEQAIILEKAKVGIALLQADQFLKVNSYLCNKIAVDQDTLEGERIWSIVNSDDRAGVERLLKAQEQGAEAKADLRLTTSDAWYEVAVAGIEGANVGVWIFSDVTARVEENQRSERRAAHDPLTGLLNRSGFESTRLVSPSDATVTAVVSIDLDGFKAVNDKFGHHAGDAVLAATGHRLLQAVRSTDIAARRGGDEFIVALADVQSVEVLHAFCVRLQTALCASVLYEGANLPIGASIGAALGTRLTTVEALERASDEAMYVAKRRADGRPEVVSLDDEA